MSQPPPLPDHSLVFIGEEVIGESGFLYVRRMRYQVKFSDGTQSTPFIYDCVGRAKLDAVVMAIHYRSSDGTQHIYLRSSIRPPLHARPLHQRPIQEKESLGALWELPAGLIEPEEVSEVGLRKCASRETLEELGFNISSDNFTPLGSSTFPAPGVIGERHFYFRASVNPEDMCNPTEDGSALEMKAHVCAVPLAHALTWVQKGFIEDTKTELGIRRLWDLEQSGELP